MKGRTMDKNANRAAGRGRGLSRAMVGVGIGALSPGLSRSPVTETEMMLAMRDKTRARIAAGPIAAVAAVSSAPSRSAVVDHPAESPSSFAPVKRSPERMNPDEFTAIVKAVLATLQPPPLNDAEMAVFVEEAARRVAATYPRPGRRALFGVRAVAAAYGVKPEWIHAMYRSGQLRHATEVG